MKTIVMNTAVMPTSGTYVCKRISMEEFVDRLRSAEDLESAIGYPTTQEYLKK